MRKFLVIGLVVVLLAFSVVPVMAKGPNNGNGNGNNSGQNGNPGDQSQTRQREKDRDQERVNNPGRGGNQNPGMRVRTPFYLQGMIVSTDSLTMTVTISVTHGNAQVKQFIGNDITVKASDTTKIFKLTQGDEAEGAASPAPSTGSTEDETPANKVAITFSQLAAGDVVAIHGNVVGGVYEATSITVYVKSAQAGLSQTPPASLEQVLATNFGFLHHLRLKIGKLVVNLP